MKSIMPPGYSKAATRKRLIEKLTQARAQDFTNASAAEQKRIREEVEREADRKLIELYGKPVGGNSVLWSH